MIVEALLILIYTFFELTFSSFDIPSVAITDLSSFYDYLDLIVEFGVSLVNLFLPFDFCQFLIGIVIGIELLIDIYQVVLWVYRKIPIFNGS